MKMIPYGQHYIDKDDVNEVAKILRFGWITQGSHVGVFEKKLCRYLGVRYAVAISSGTAGLHIACLAAGLGKKDEVITSPLTFVATANAILYSGAKPVFADVEADTANIDPVDILRKIRSGTKVILPVHYAGLPCDMPVIKKIARRNKLIIIEDACHALGTRYRHGEKWFKVGSCAHSDMAVFSFHPVKSITTGEGGVVTTNNKRYYEKLLKLRSHGIYRSKKLSEQEGLWYYEMRDLGFNYRITDFQCALGVSQLKKVDRFIGRRRQIADRYNKLFFSNPYFDLPPRRPGSESSWHLYPIRLRCDHSIYKKNIFKAFKRCGINVQTHYMPVYLHPYYKKFGYRQALCPRSEEFYRKEISLPIYFSLTDAGVDYVVAKTLNIFSSLNSERI